MWTVNDVLGSLILFSFCAIKRYRFPKKGIDFPRYHWRSNKENSWCILRIIYIIKICYRWDCRSGWRKKGCRSSWWLKFHCGYPRWICSEESYQTNCYDHCLWCHWVWSQASDCQTTERYWWVSSRQSQWRYSCNKITTTWIEMSRQNWNGFSLSNTSHQIMI